VLFLDWAQAGIRAFRLMMGWLLNGSVMICAT
jgi:hypothetical protein